MPPCLVVNNGSKIRSTLSGGIARNHQFAVARRNGIWEVVETPELKEAKSEIKRLNDELEQRVAERTHELTEANLELRRALEEVEKLRQRLESENAYLREEVRESSCRFKFGWE